MACIAQAGAGVKKIDRGGVGENLRASQAGCRGLKYERVRVFPF